MSTREVEARLTVRGVDKLTGPLGKMGGAAGKFGAKAKKELGQLKNLRGPVKLIEDFRKTESVLSKSANKFKLAQTRVAELKKEFKAVEEPTAKMRREMDRAQKAARKASTEFRSAKDALKLKRTAMQEAGIDAKNLASKERELANAIGKVNSKLDANWQKYKKVSEQQKQWAATKRQMDESLGRATGLAATGYAGMHSGKRVLGGLKDPVNEAKGFEEEMQAVGAVTRTIATKSMSEAKREAKKRQFGVLKNLALSLGESTSFTNIQAASAQRFLGMAGMSVPNIVKSLPSVLNLAKAGRTDLAQTADISSNIMSGYGMSGKDMGRISDVLVGTFTRSNVNVKQIGETLKYVGPKAKAAGLSLEYVAAATGKLGDAGIQGSMAGTALRSVISRLAGPPKMAKKALSRLGVETKDLNGNLKPFEQILDDIAGKMKKLGSAEQIELTKKIAGEEGSSAFTVLLEQRAAIQALRDELKKAKGEAAEVAGIMADAATGDEKLAESAWSSLKTEIGTQLLPDYRELLQTTTKLINTGREWAKENPELVKSIAYVTGAVGGLLVVGGGLAFALAGVVGSVALLKAAFAGKALLGGIGSFGSGLDTYAGKADKAAKSNRRLSGSFRNLRKIGLGVGGGLAALDAIQKTDDFNSMTPEQRKVLAKKQDDWAKSIPVIGDLYKWTSSFRGDKPAGASMPIRDELAAKQQRLADLDREIMVKRSGAPNAYAAGAITSGLQSERDKLAAEIGELSGRIRQSDLANALGDQASGVKSAPLAQALHEKAAQLRAVRISAGGGKGSGPALVQVDKQLAKGGGFGAGDRIIVGEKGPELMSFDQPGHVTPNHALGSALGQGSGGLSIGEIHVHGSEGMDAQQLAQAVRQELERMWRQAGMTSYQNKGFA